MIGFNLNKLSKKDKIKEIKIGENPKDDLDLLIFEIKTQKINFDEQKVRKAFQMCLNAHSNKLRKSGDPFYTHLLETARILIHEIPLDESSIIAALLHEILGSNSAFEYKDIKLEFGSTVAEIVEGVNKIEHIESHHLNKINQLENYRRLLLSMLKDVRIILIKIADRLHNMRTLEYISPESQINFSRETLEVYAPFANRFGLRNIKWELEDLSFKYLDPESYYDIRNRLKSTREQREEYINELINPIDEMLANDSFLKKNKIKFELKGRPKHIYSIYNKMIARGKKMEELYDLHAFRIILDTEDPYMCFYVYGLIASIYKPLPETFKDYISAPKKNGYQSLHTGLIGKKNIAVEMQIRTRKMHDYAEKGVAAHFIYKDNVDHKSILDSDEIYKWVSEVREIIANLGDKSSEILLENVKKNLLVDDIYVFTPNNEYVTMPRDSTPLDYAFAIHTDIGYKCIGAKVNGKIVPLTYKLQSGDQIEILTSENTEPNRSWLKKVNTVKAKNLINKYLKDKRKLIEDKGRDIWLKKSKERGFNLAEKNFELLIKSLKFADKNDFYYALGKENVDLSKVYMFIKYKIRDGFKIPYNSMKKDFAFSTGQRSEVNNSSAKSFIERSTNDNLNQTNSNDTKGPVKVELIINSLNSPTVIQELNNIIMKDNDIDIIGINFESGEKNIQGFLKLKLPNNVILNNIVQKMSSVHGVHNIDINSLN